MSGGGGLGDGGDGDGGGEGGVGGFGGLTGGFGGGDMQIGEMSWQARGHAYMSAEIRSGVFTGG